MIFNGTNFKEHLIVNDVRRSILPPQEPSLIKIPGKIGRKLRKKDLGEGVIEVDITLVEKGLMELREKTRWLAGLLYVVDEKELRFSDDPGKHYMATLSGNTDLENIAKAGRGTLTFLCPDPLAYGDKKTIHLSTDTTFYNTGTYATTGAITINITENIDHIELTLQNTGEFIYAEHDFVAGDKVIINLEKEVVYKNGYSIIPDVYLESDYFNIQVGENRITGNVNATLEFVERWL